MSDWTRSPLPSPMPSEDPASALVEEHLDAVAERAPSSSRRERPVAKHALRICACVTPTDSPDWLVYDTESGPAWRRVPGGVHDEGLVDAAHLAGGHAAPSEVLRWLRGEVADPWGLGGDGSGDPRVLEELGRQLRAG